MPATSTRAPFAWSRAAIAALAVLAVVSMSVAPALAAPPWKDPEQGGQHPGRGSGRNQPAEEEPDAPVEEEPDAPVDEEPGSPVYSSDSPWNTPISADAPVHPDSEAFVARFHSAASDGHQRPLTSDPTQYSYGIYRVDAETPERTIQLSGNYSDVVDETTNRTSSAPTLRIPIPADAQPSPGTDASIIIWDAETGDEWGFWEFQSHGDGTYSARNGYHYNTRWSGVPPTAPNRFGSRGAGLPYFAGLVRRDEIDAGRVQHALAFAYDYPSPEYVWPATKSDGWGDVGVDVPEGARIRIAPSYTEADFEAWGLTREGKILARALQEYGMYTIDRAGRPKIMIEDEATAAWDGTITASTVSAIPWDAFEVIDWRAPKPPMAVLGADTEVAPGTLVTLDASASYGIDGTSLRAFDWDAPDGAHLEDATTMTPTWDTAGLEPGSYQFALRVEDTNGAWSTTATIVYTIAAAELPTVLEGLSFGGTYTGSVGSGSWTPLADEELVTVVALRPASTTVEEVTGNGLEWSRVMRQRDTQGELAVEVWRASGPAPTSGPVEVSASGSAWAFNVQALRLTPSSVVASAGAETGEVDTRYPSVTLESSVDRSLSLGVHVGRKTPFTADAGLDEVSAHSVGDAGNHVAATILSRPSSQAGTHTLGGTQSSALDWVMAGLVIRSR